MQNLRKHGAAPYRIAVIHGGPGAPGSVASVARELSTGWGVLEPLQTAASLDGQIEEMHAVLAEHADLPITLVGWSWGAMLSFIFAARYPGLVGKLILVSSGGFEARYAAPVMGTRLSRLSHEEQGEVSVLLQTLNDPASVGKDAALARLGALFRIRADTFDPLTLDDEGLGVQYAIHERVWGDASRLRESGELLALSRRITCPVIAIHGDYDPHPAGGVREPLAAVLRDFRFVLLKNCGHYPWNEREARDEFYKVLRRELV